MSIKSIYVIVVVIVFLSCKKEEKAPSPIANFFVEIKNCDEGLCEVNFYDTSENAKSWDWSISGEVATTKNVVVNLIEGNTYIVVLKVKNNDGLEAVKSKKINV